MHVVVLLLAYITFYNNDHAHCNKQKNLHAIGLHPCLLEGYKRIYLGEYIFIAFTCLYTITPEFVLHIRQKLVKKINLFSEQITEYTYYTCL